MSIQEKIDRVVKELILNVLAEKRKLEQTSPLEYKTLYELLESPQPSIRLTSGDLHRISRRELLRLASILPWYLHRLVKLPLVFKYKRSYWDARFILLNNDRWSARALGYIFSSRIIEKRELSIEEFQKLIRLFKSLIFIIIEVEL